LTIERSVVFYYKNVLFEIGGKFINIDLYTFNKISFEIYDF